MSQGTLSISNTGQVITGSGTSFTSDLKANDFVVITVGGVTYTLAVFSVTNDTSLLLTTPYLGPSVSGAAWTAVANAALVGITAQIAADVARAIRGLNLDKSNWQQVYSGSGNITVTLPDGSIFSGPSWNNISTSVANKLDKTGGEISGDLTTKQALNVQGSLSADLLKNVVFKGGVQGGPGANNNITMLTATGSTGTGGYTGAFVYNWYSDGWITGVTRGSGTNTLAYSIYYNGASTGGNGKTWSFNYDGTATGAGAWNVGSDGEHKSEIEKVPNPLSAVCSWSGVTYKMLDSGYGVGLIAQDVAPWCPTAVRSYGKRVFSNGLSIDEFKTLDIAGVSAAYHTESIKALFDLLSLALDDPDSCRKKIKEIREGIIEGWVK